MEFGTNLTAHLAEKSKKNVVHALVERALFYDGAALDEMVEIDGVVHEEAKFYGIGMRTGEFYALEYKDVNLMEDKFYRLQEVTPEMALETPKKTA